MDILNYIDADRLWDVVLLFLGGTFFIQITPIEVNPWSWMLRKIGNLLNADTNERLGRLEEAFDKHIEESEREMLRRVRTDILGFADMELHGHVHSKEDFDFILSEIDSYENYCKCNDISNNVAEHAIKEIERRYDLHMQNNDFLAEI